MKDSMDCAEFQKALPEYMDSGEGAEEENHLRSCPVCSDLLQDLKYIVDAAKLLVPMEDPSPRVWKGIVKSLQDEGFVRPAGGPARPRPFLVPVAGRSAYYGWAAIAAMAITAIVLIVYYKTQPAPTPQAEASSQNSTLADLDGDDQQFLTEVAAHSPAMRAAYETNLRDVNAYISDARQSVEQNPEDDAARDQLMQAYEQKNALYEMGLIRSSQ